MASFFSHKKQAPEERPQLELSGPALTTALQTLVASCESSGGVEKFVDALKLKTTVFQNAFKENHGADVDADAFARICGLMPTVRRRIGDYLEDDAYPALQKAVTGLFADDEPDVRLAAFCASFPDDKRHRWVRDLAAEILHNTDPERFPLMCRWVWDKKANSGVIREIWYGDVDHLTLDVEDNFETYLMLREELSQFLTTNGIYQDILSYVDLLCAQVYAEYVAAQGGSYLKADFSAAEDPVKHMRRLLGLDGVRAKTTRNISGPIDGNAQQIEEAKLLTGDLH